jgi:hypothetical protein
MIMLDTTNNTLTRFQVYDLPIDAVTEDRGYLEYELK